MGIDLNVIIILFMVIIAPLWIIFHYGSKKSSRGLMPDDERMLEDLWRSAKEMERRLADLEAIVEPEAPRSPTDNRT